MKKTKAKRAAAPQARPSNYQRGWQDAALYTARLIKAVQWPPGDRPRLRALTEIVYDVASVEAPAAPLSRRHGVPGAGALRRPPAGQGKGK